MRGRLSRIKLYAVGMCNATLGNNLKTLSHIFNDNKALICCKSSLTGLCLMFSDPSLHFLAAQGEIAKIKEEIDKGVFKYGSNIIGPVSV